jgi:putative hemolysin
MARKHIVDVLIAERAPHLAASRIWPLVRPALYQILGYRKAREMADVVVALGGADAMKYVSRLLQLKVSTYGLERAPRNGRLILVCNHPTGISDGIAMFDALMPVRPDAIFFANADALRVSSRLGEVVIPVEWVESKRSREKTRDTLLRARQALESERCVVVFPAGRLAVRGADGQLSDPPWMASAASLARKYNAVVVPVHMTGPWSTLFHFFGRFSQELRDITLFHEMLNKKGKSYSVTFGHPIAPGDLDVDAKLATEALKRYVERALPADPDGHFK